MILRENELKISIHAPTRGATIGRHVPSTSICISIHAPTRGATNFLLLLKFGIRYFNPRSHERSDNSGIKSVQCRYNFNPRSHERSDNYTFKVCYGYMIFQSTLPREERQRYTFFIPSQLIAFQSTLPREERQAGDTYTDIMYIDFNPRSHERSDRERCIKWII